MAGLRPAAGAALVAALTILGGGIVPAARFHAQAAASDTLIFGSTEEPDTLNPLITTLTVGADVDAAVYDALLVADTSNHPQPQLATSYSSSPDGRTWVFHLRHGVRWADGQPLTSADVAFTYHAILNKKNNISSTQGFDQIDQFSTPDPYTVRMHIKQTYAPFLTYVAYQSIMPRHLYSKPGVDFNKASYNRTPIGTGPYMVTEWKTADHITLVPNPYSWRGQPFFKKIVYKIVPNPLTLLVQLHTGDVDMTGGGGTIGPAQYAEARAIAGKRLISSDANSWKHINLTQWGFLREDVVRQALDYATPKEAILKGIVKGLGMPAYADIDPAIKDFYNPNLPRHPFSLARAAALLRADGFAAGPDGVLQKGGRPFEMELWAQSSDDIGQRIDSVLKTEWARIGIRVTLRTEGTVAFFGPGGPSYTKGMNGVTFAWSNSNDVDDSYFWNSSQIPTSPTGSGGNQVSYFYKFGFQKQLDSLTNAGLTTIDTGKRRAIYFQIQRILADKVPVIFLYWQQQFSVIPDNMAGFMPTPFSKAFWNVAQWKRG